MQMILQYENGLRADALLLAMGDGHLRVIIRGAKDATSLRLIKDQWMTEEGDAVDIESLMLTGGVLTPESVAAWGHAA
jgi:hypothetical protein